MKAEEKNESQQRNLHIREEPYKLIEVVEYNMLVVKRKKKEYNMLLISLF